MFMHKYGKQTNSLHGRGGWGGGGGRPYTQSNVCGKTAFVHEHNTIGTVKVYYIFYPS